MKKQIFLLTIMVLMMFSCSCFAGEPTTKDCSLGGIAPFMTYDQVVAMYGEPTSQKGSFGTGENAYLSYGNTVQIQFANGVVSNIFSIGNNGWRLPNGISVGSQFKDLVALWGTPPLSFGKGKYGDYYGWRVSEGICHYTICVTYDTVGKKGADAEKITSVQVSSLGMRDKFE